MPLFSAAPVHISALDIDLLFETAEVAAEQLPVAPLAAVYAEVTACPDDTRWAAVATAATRGLRRAAAAAAVVALGIPRRHHPPVGGGSVGRCRRVGPPRVCPRSPPTRLHRRWSRDRRPRPDPCGGGRPRNCLGAVVCLPRGSGGGSGGGAADAGGGGDDC